MDQTVGLVANRLDEIGFAMSEAVNGDAADKIDITLMLAIVEIFTLAEIEGDRSPAVGAEDEFIGFFFRG